MQTIETLRSEDSALYQRYAMDGRMRKLMAQLVNSKTLRKLVQSLGPYCLAAAILPGGIVLAPLLFLLRRRKPALQAALLRIGSTSFDRVMLRFHLEIR